MLAFRFPPRRRGRDGRPEGRGLRPSAAEALGGREEATGAGALARESDCRGQPGRRESTAAGRRVAARAAGERPGGVVKGARESGREGIMGGCPFNLPAWYVGPPSWWMPWGPHGRAASSCGLAWPGVAPLSSPSPPHYLLSLCQSPSTNIIQCFCLPPFILYFFMTPLRGASIFHPFFV